MTVSVDSSSRLRLGDWYSRNRARSRALFDLIDPAVYYTRPIALRNPIVFYEGHLPAFSVIAFLKRGLGVAGVDERLERLFARGIDPDSVQSAVPRSGAATDWPTRDEVLAFASEADARVLDALDSLNLDPAAAVGGRGAAAEVQGAFTALEHEAMHQETLLYMWHRLPHHHKSRPADVRYELDAAPPRYERIAVPAGRATLGARRTDLVFGWDNEFEELAVDVPAFDIDKHSVTNANFFEFLADGGYDRGELWSESGWEWRVSENVRTPAFWTERDGQWFWRGMFEDIPLPLAWPVYVSQAEADAYARWKGRRLPTESEYHRAAFGIPAGSDAPPAHGHAGADCPACAAERSLPWGDAATSPAEPARGNFDFASWEPVPAGSRPAGASAWGVHDLIGNGWEWTASEFAPFPGFAAMPTYPEYSAEFFDGQHFVLKGASPATARELVRRTFRNWFRPNYPYVYAKFRTVSIAGR